MKWPSTKPGAIQTEQAELLRVYSSPGLDLSQNAAASR